MRLKGLHILTVSRATDVLVKILKQIFSAKMGNRIHVHMTLESLHEHVSKDCLPEEFGGQQKSLFTLCGKFFFKRNEVLLITLKKFGTYT